jgi:outer membrane protein assembly factor BamB/tetratricopeptide (TPR) repeat protein
MSDIGTVIFCPNCQHFIGDRDHCRHCGWVRPTQTSRVGRFEWTTARLTEESLPGAPAYPTQLTQFSGLICMSLDTGEILTFEASTGRRVWNRVLRDDRLLRTNGVAAWRDELLIGSENLSELPTRDRVLLIWSLIDGTDRWRWPTEGDSLSVPLVVGDVAYFASSEPRVYALDLPTRTLQWSALGLTWSPEMPALFDQTLVVPSRGPQVSAYSLLDGQRLWLHSVDNTDDEWLNYRPVVTATSAYLSGWRNNLYAVDRLSGERLWVFRAERGITCAPVLVENKLLIGVKDYRETGAQRKPGYGLYALDSSTGEVVWKVCVDKHILSPPAIAGDVVLLASDDRRLRALKASDGSELWQVTLPEKPRAGPLVIGDRVVVGQRDGTLHSIWWQAEPPIYPDPDVLLVQHRPLEAAIAMSLRGDYAGAARLFEHAGEWRSAAALWLEAGELIAAAKCYAQAQEFASALDIYRQIGDRPSEADTLAQQSKHAEAAAIYEGLGDIDHAVAQYLAAERIVYAAGLLQAAGRRREAIELYLRAHQDDQAAELMIKDGRYADAAEIYRRLNRPEAAIGVLLKGELLNDAAALYEQLGQLRSAAELYEKAGRGTQALGLYRQIPDWARVAELAEKLEDLPQAASAWMQIGQLPHAAELFERAGQFDSAIEVYESLSAWDKVESLARKSARWSKQAEALLQRGLTTQAAEAYERAADQAYGTNAAREEVALLYEAAAKHYAEDENWPKHGQCWQRVCELRQWPYLHGRVQIDTPFFQGEYNLLEVLLHNYGAGQARKIQVRSISSKFMLDLTETQEAPSLSPGQDGRVSLSVRPQPKMLGKSRLRIKVAYFGPDKREFEETVECQVEVRAHDEKLAELSRPTPLPVTPRRRNYTGGSNEMVDALVDGDQIQASEPDESMTLSGPEMAKWSEALGSAYALDELTQMLKFRLDKNLQDISIANSYKTVVFMLIENASRFGWELDLLRAARQSNPRNAKLQALAARYGLALAGPASLQLEKLIKASNSFLNIAAWREKLGELEMRVCRVEIKGSPVGTGFLVGPSAVMTNHHVIQSVLTGEDGPGDVALRFDYKVLSGGKTLYGTPFRLASGKDDWLIAASPSSAVDLQPEPKQGTPGEDELDYALLRVGDEVGRQPVGERPDPKAPPRGWIEVLDQPYEFKPNSALHIIQHPLGEPLKLSLQQEAVLGLNGNETRVKYTTNTEPGSSGSPCFNANWNLIALHHGGEPAGPAHSPARYNEGIPVQRIAAALRREGVMSALSDS